MICIWETGSAFENRLKERAQLKEVEQQILYKQDIFSWDTNLQTRHNFEIIKVVSDVNKRKLYEEYKITK